MDKIKPLFVGFFGFVWKFAVYFIVAAFFAAWWINGYVSVVSHIGFIIGCILAAMGVISLIWTIIEYIKKSKK